MELQSTGFELNGFGNRCKTYQSELKALFRIFDKIQMLHMALMH
jgi:hypothetical protein